MFMGYGYQVPLGGALGAVEDGLMANPCNPTCTYDAVTVFYGPDYTGGRMEYAGGPKDVWASDSFRKEGLWISGGSIFVPPGFRVRLIADANYNQWQRQPHLELTGPVAMPQVQLIRILVVQDMRTEEDKARIRQLLALAKEEAIAQQEADIAARAAQAAQETADALAQQQQAAAAREIQREGLIRQQAASEAEQEVARMVAMQEAARAAARNIPTVSRRRAWMTPAMIGGGGILLLLLLASRR